MGGRYTLIEQLGAGGFGQTFLAKDLHLPGQPHCVIKQLKPHDRSPQHMQVARRLFDTEARTLYQLGSHPQIPRLLAHFEDGGEFYLAQELIDGHSLTEEFYTTASWDTVQVVAFLSDVLGILTFVHDHRVIHRDLKPSNLIRRRRDGRIVMIDFGAVKQASTQLISAAPGTNPTVAVGTQGYMPSEQLAGRPQFSSDIYAVGVMGINALTGQDPEHLAPNATTGEIDWHRYAPNAPDALRTVLDTMVRYDFRARYATAREAIAALQALPPHLVQHLAPPISDLPASDLPATPEHAAQPSLPQSPSGSPPSPPPKTQQTIAVAGHRPASGYTANPTAATPTEPGPPIATEQNPRPAPSHGRAVAFVAIAAVIAAGVGLWRACAPSLSPVPSDQTAGQTFEAEALTPAEAEATVTEFYEQVSAQSWSAARAMTAGTLAQQFNPSFFRQFERVTVENLRVTAQTAETLTLAGQNTYRYPDGSSQLEARTFTLQRVEGQPRIVASDFVRVIKAR